MILDHTQTKDPTSKPQIMSNGAFINDVTQIYLMGKQNWSFLFSVALGDILRMIKHKMLIEI